MARDYSAPERQRLDLERKRNLRANYDRILIVTEGSKTEPNYFREILTEYRLNTANIQIHPSGLGTQPLQVVDYAHDLFLHGDTHKRIGRRAFEQIFAVFDRDDHPTYFQALDKAEALDGKLRNDLKQPVRFQAVASIPCFELWLLLHFEDIQAPFQRDEVLRRLSRHIPGYTKGSDNIFARTKPLAPTAVSRADRLCARFSAYDDPSPHTDVGALVNLLMHIRQ